MPFGLTNALATFQACIDKALGEFLDITCVVYLDDILIFSKDESDHEEHCSFNTTEVDFLGFRINTEGIFMDLERICAVEEWLPPQDIHQLQVFLGFADFFRRFIKNYSRIAALLLNLLKTGKNKKEIGVKVQQTNVVPPPFPLSETALEAFKALKEAFMSAPLLRYFDENKPMRVETDASAFTISGILTQQFKIDGHLHWLPVAYYSKKLLDTETQYGTGEQELLAIVEAMHHWRYYCQGARHSIVVLTDHANLVWFMTTPNLTKRQLKWAKKLAEYDFNITYREGKKNPADGLSRRPDYKLPKASTTLIAAETEKLYMLAVMTLRPRRPVQQVRQEDVVPDTNMDVGMDDGGAATAEESTVRRLPAREASRNGDAVVQRDNVVLNINMDSGTTGTPAVRNLPA
ncbi:gag polymerase env [Lasallia pustulata]|uniref:Gag polymerase env n=1 Tax=Lasallia pustulata TaxID=136370 RepID=A0A1W5CVK4_9LECA|nr:gag polymerase env [Lasallia pustulata]